MVEGIFNGSKKKVKIGSTYYGINNDTRFWQSVLVHGQRVSGKLVPGPGNENSSNKAMLQFDLDSSHLKTAMRGSSVKRRR